MGKLSKFQLTEIVQIGMFNNDSQIVASANFFGKNMFEQILGESLDPHRDP